MARMRVLTHHGKGLLYQEIMKSDELLQKSGRMPKLYDSTFRGATKIGFGLVFYFTSQLTAMVMSGMVNSPNHTFFLGKLE